MGFAGRRQESGQRCARSFFHRLGGQARYSNLASSPDTPYTTHVAELDA